MKPGNVQPIAVSAFISLLLGAISPAVVTAQPAAKGVSPRWRFAPTEKKLPKPAQCAAFSRDSKFLVVGWDKGDIQALDMQTGKPAFVLTSNRSPLSMAFSPDGKTLALSDKDKTVTLWSWPSRKVKATLKDFARPMQFAFFTPDDRLLGLSLNHFLGGTQKIELWDLSAQKILKTWDEMIVKDADLSPDGKTLAIVNDRDVIGWSPTLSAEVFHYFHDAKNYARKVRFAPDGLTIATALADGQVDLLDARTWKRQSSFHAGKGSVHALAFSADSIGLVTRAQNSDVQMWDLSNLEASKPIALIGSKPAAMFFQFSSDGKWLACGDEQGQVCLWEIEHDKWFTKAAKPDEPKRPRIVGSPRLALVSAVQTPTVQNLLTLAEAKLSTEVELVERRDIEKILAEQKLSTAGFIKEDQVVKVGKLLGVRLFAVLEAAPKSSMINLVVFDAATGVRVWDAPLPDADLDTMTVGVSQAVRGAVDKHRKLDKGLKTICITAVRNAGLPPSREAVCETISFLLERGFVSSPSLALLERTRLDHILKERGLGTDAPTQDLLASLVRIELECSPGAEGKGIAATALLFDGAGKKLGKVNVNLASENPVDVAQAMQEKVLKLLEATPAAAVPNRAKEANRFVDEAEFWMHIGDRPRAIRALEVAVALDPANREHLKRLIGFSAMTAEQVLYNMPTEGEVFYSLQLMHRASAEAIRVEEEESRLAKQTHPHKDFTSPNSYMPALNKLTKSLPPRSRELADEVQRNITLLNDLRLERVLTWVRDKQSFDAMMTTVRFELPNPAYLAEQTPEMRTILQKHLTRLVALAGEFGTAPQTPEEVTSIYGMIRMAQFMEVPAAALTKYRAALRASKNSYVTLYDRLVDDQCNFDRQKPARADQAKSLAAYRLFVQDRLTNDPARAMRVFRWHCYNSFVRLFSDTVGSLFDDYDDSLGAEVCALAEFMMERKDYQDRLAGLTCHGVRNLKARPNAQRAVAYADGLVNLLDAADTQILLEYEVKPDAVRGFLNSYKGHIGQRRQAILNWYPDLAARVAVWNRLDEFIDVLGSRKGIVRLNMPIVHANAVYLVALGQEGYKVGHYVQLCRFSLPDGKKTLLGKIAVNTGYRPEMPSQEPNRIHHHGSSIFVVDGLIHDGRYYVGTRDQGILIFPLDGGKVEWLNTANGLPSDHVHSLTCVGDSLFAGVGGYQKPSHLIVHDLKRGQTKIIASSSRVDVQSPFDDSQPWFVEKFVADPPRHRALAFFTSGGGGGGSAVGRLGLWAIDAKETRFNQLYAAYLFQWMSPVFDEKLLLATRETTLLDLKTNQIKSIKPTAGLGASPHVESRLSTVGNLLKPEPLPQQLCHAHFIYDGWLWAANDFSRLSLDGKKKELLADPRKNAKRQFLPFEGFQMIGTDQMLMADLHGMWLATLPPPRR